MTIFSEPISLWISIIALLISLVSLFIARRKQKFDERTVLANYIERIKTTYGEGVKHSIDILAEFDKYEKSLTKDRTEDIEIIHKLKLIMTKTKSKYEDVYKKLGHQDIKTFDPVVLSSIVVESKTLIENFKLMKRIIKTLDS